MKNPLRPLWCFVAPLHSRNILYLIKRGRLETASFLLRLHLRVFRGASVARVHEVADRLRPDVLKALGMLGFIRLHNEALDVVREARTCQQQSEQVWSDLSHGRLGPFLGGRSVALVGPSQGSDNAAEIDRYDLVIRVGYSGRDSLPEGTGCRCDMAFYQTHKLRGMAEQGNFSPLHSLSAILVGSKEDREFVMSLGIDPSRVIELSPLRFRFGSANALVRVLSAVVACAPSQVKIFNADLFLSTLYPKGYHANKRVLGDEGGWRYEDAGMCRSFASKHNPLEQLIFYKILHSQGHFEADEKLGQIIGLSESEYLEKIDALYGEPLRGRLGLES